MSRSTGPYHDMPNFSGHANYTTLVSSDYPDYHRSSNFSDHAAYSNNSPTADYSVNYGNPRNKDNTKGEEKPQEQTNYKMVKEGWGSRPNFQASYGLPMDPDGIQEGNKILDAFREYDWMAAKEQSDPEEETGQGDPEDEYESCPRAVPTAECGRESESENVSGRVESYIHSDGMTEQEMPYAESDRMYETDDDMGESSDYYDGERYSDGGYPHGEY